MRPEIILAPGAGVNRPAVITLASHREMTLAKQLEVKGWAQEGPGPPASLELNLGQGWEEAGISSSCREGRRANPTDPS